MSHEERISAQASAFTEAMKTFEATVDRLDDAAAGRGAADGGWTPAQIAWHVGQTNELLAAVISGQAPMANPAPPGFVENPEVFAGIPPRIQTFPQLVPPDGVTRAEGLARLRESAGPYLQSLRSLTPERASGYCVDFPFGKISLYQLAEFGAAHVTRHHRQVERALAGT